MVHHAFRPIVPCPYSDGAGYLVIAVNAAMALPVCNAIRFCLRSDKLSLKDMIDSALQLAIGWMEQMASGDYFRPMAIRRSLLLAFRVLHWHFRSVILAS